VNVKDNEIFYTAPIFTFLALFRAHLLNILDVFIGFASFFYKDA